MIEAAPTPCPGPEDQGHGKVHCGDCGKLVRGCSCRGDDVAKRYLPGPCAKCKRIVVGFDHPPLAT